MNDQLISVLAPDRDILHFEPRLVIALNPLEEEKQVQTDVLLSTICKDQPGFEVRFFRVFLCRGRTSSKVFCRWWRKMRVAKLWSYFSRTSRDGIPS